MFSYSQSIGRPGTSLPTLYYLSNVYALKLLVPTSTNTKKLIISHWCYFQLSSPGPSPSPSPCPNRPPSQIKVPQKKKKEGFGPWADTKITWATQLLSMKECSGKQC